MESFVLLEIRFGKMRFVRTSFAELLIFVCIHDISFYNNSKKTIHSTGLINLGLNLNVSYCFTVVVVHMNK